MKETRLFRAHDGAWVTNTQILRALQDTVTPDCRVLYMHTGLSFGVPNPDMGRKEVLASLYEAVQALGVPTLCVPTFTFSFCNGEPYDVAHSKSRMGALNEYIRQQPGTIRSVDPLMSVALVGEDRDLVESLGHASIGADSTFDKLSRRKDVEFLFLGVRLGDCFTYMHYLEWVAHVPYRYDRKFTGQITHAGRTYEDTYSLFVRYNNVTPNAASYEYENQLIAKGLERVAVVGDNAIRGVCEPAARELYLELLRRDPNYYITKPFVLQQADPTFVARDMVAL
ncbi:MAG: AAC(3) family N-acetyltransferase [Kiritimatiellia bacterium]